MKPPRGFKEVPGFPGYYVNRKGVVLGQKGQPLTVGTKAKTGHHFVQTTPSPGKNKKLYVHAAVMLAFVGPRPHEAIIRHLDGNPQNNNLKNLKYGTQKENMEDCLLHGTRAKGEKVGSSVLTRKIVSKIRKRRSTGESFRSIARAFGVHHKTIMLACSGATWSHVPEKNLQSVSRK